MGSGNSSGLEKRLITLAYKPKVKEVLEGYNRGSHNYRRLD